MSSCALEIIYVVFEYFILSQRNNERNNKLIKSASQNYMHTACVLPFVFKTITIQHDHSRIYESYRIIISINNFKIINYCLCVCALKSN